MSNEVDSRSVTAGASENVIVEPSTIAPPLVAGRLISCPSNVACDPKGTVTVLLSSAKTTADTTSYMLKPCSVRCAVAPVSSVGSCSAGVPANGNGRIIVVPVDLSLIHI